MTITQERRTDMYLRDRQTLKTFMELHNYTVRGLAVAVARELRKKDKKATCSHSSIGHLSSGERTYVSPERARAISQLLSTPEAVLFLAKVSTVARETPPVRK